jgi:hypothetical protein
MLSILAGLALLLPGACWWVWVGRRDEDPVEVLASVLGVSISLNALMALLFFILKIKLNLVGLLVVVASWLGVIVFRIIKKRDIKLGWIWVVAIAGFGGVVAWRLFQARDLLMPAWVDSLHHVLIVRKIIEFGGLPPDLVPYLDVPFYYHYAFHTIAAQFSVLTGLSPDQAVLVIGQVMNAAIGLSAYALGKAIFKDWRPAFLAGLLVTFVTKMPAYYLTWGRYTLMTGMILLPLAMALGINLLTGERKRSDYVAMGLLSAGTLLAHYFTGILLAIFLVILGVGHLNRAWSRHQMDWQPLLGLTAAALTGFILALPWLWRVFAFTRMSVELSTNLPSELGEIFANQDQWQYLWYLLGDNGGHLLIFGCIPALILAFLNPRYREMAVWGAILALLALPRGLQLGSFRFDHFAIVLFLPLALFFSLFISAGMRFLDKVTQRKWTGWVLIVLVGLGAVIWGGFETKDIINPRTVFTTQADLDAIAWIDENLPQDARFFINTTTWGYGVSRGVDGGVWILPLTGRWTVAPTLFYTFGEDVDQMKQIMDWGEKAQEVTGCSDGLWKLVNEADLTHIYLRDDKGRLSAGALEGCEGIEKVYVQGGVRIFEVGK